ncbi:unnamed protein product [Microthlaspi erraticum]|uniref:Xylanase inhibitor C-terminal domain-containing protein n=1 Tax=Microthlaspi erraticum TaxID=1685480 RepID=A0A6D2JGQ4_9BRAS|nr:unnamed protein product [Microthlaspi erraticum]
MAIGYPMIQQRLHIDSGTDLTYVLQNPHSDYNPLASSSFRYRSCLGLRSASLTPGAMKGRCDFEKRGQLAGTGTLGLAPGDLSITSSFNKTFSICLGNLNRFQRTNEFLALGDGAVLSGPTVALGNLLNVTMTSIAINEQNLGLDILLSMSLTIMDTGHSALSLVSNAYHAVIGNIKEKMVAYENAYTTDYNPLLCYNGKIPKNLGINLSLGIGNVTINFPKRKLFYQMRRDVYCLIVDESVNGRNYIGIMAFQDLNVGSADEDIKSSSSEEHGIQSPEEESMNLRRAN